MDGGETTTSAAGAASAPGVGANAASAEQSLSSSSQAAASVLVDADDILVQNCRRLVMLGSPKVGKTAIVSRFLNNKFEDRYTPTIEDFHRKVYKIRRETYRLDILDTSGNNPFPAMRRLSLLTGDLFILIYSIDSRESFEEISRLIDQVLEAKGHPPGVDRGKGLSRYRKTACSSGITPIIIVGNKCDREADRVVETGELRCLASEIADWPVGFVETSAKKNVNIEEIFLKLFALAKLPAEMSPSLHSKINPSSCLSFFTASSSASSSSSPSASGAVRRGVTLRRRGSDAWGAVALNVRRPSIRTDLMMLQTNKSNSDSDSDLTKRNHTVRCCIQ